MDGNYKDLLILLYEQNEKYHDTKEKVIWLAGTVYFGFAVLVLRWVLDLPSEWFLGTGIGSPRGATLTFLSVVFGFVFWYLWFQHRAKIDTLSIFERYVELIRRTSIDYDELMGGPSPKRSFLRHRKVPGAIVMIVALLFYAAQLSVILPNDQTKVLWATAGVIVLFLLDFLVGDFIRTILARLWRWGRSLSARSKKPDPPSKEDPEPINPHPGTL